MVTVLVTLVVALPSRNAGGRTPLMSAVWGGSLACVRELVAMEGVDLTTRDRCPHLILALWVDLTVGYWGLMREQVAPKAK